MESLLPSEVARLVYGYLEDLKCSDAAQAFLETCPLLSECLAVQKSGRRVVTRVHGHSLLEIIDDHCDSYCLISEKQNGLPENLSEDIDKRKTLISKLKTLFNIIANGTSSQPKRCDKNQQVSILAAESVVTRSVGTCTADEEVCETLSEREEDLSRCQEKDGMMSSHDSPVPEMSRQMETEESVVPTTLTVEPSASGMLTTIRSEERAHSGSSSQPSTSAHEKQVDTTSTKLSMSPTKRRTPAKQHGISTPQPPSTSKDANFLSPEIFIKPMLENTQLHEKIAEAINNAMGSLDLADDEFSAIHSAVEQTQADPVFQRLVDEMFAEPEDPTSSSSPEQHDEMHHDEFEMHNLVTSTRTVSEQQQLGISPHSRPCTEVSPEECGNSRLTKVTPTEPCSKQKVPMTPLQIPVLTFPTTPLCLNIPSTPAEKILERYNTDNELNTPNHQEILTKSTQDKTKEKLVDITGEKGDKNKTDEETLQSNKADELPLKARLRTSCKKNPPVNDRRKPNAAVTLTKADNARNESVAPQDSVVSQSLDNHTEDAMEVVHSSSQLEDEQHMMDTSNQQEQCYFIKENVCVEVSPEVQAVISNNMMLAQSGSSKNILELAMSQSDLIPGSPQRTISIPVVQHQTAAHQLQPTLGLAGSNIIVLNQGALQTTLRPVSQHGLLPPQNIFLPEHGAYLPYVSPGLSAQRPRPENRLITIAPKVPVEDPVSTTRKAKRRTSRAGITRALQLSSNVPDRNIKIKKKPDPKPSSTLNNVQVPERQIEIVDSVAAETVEEARPVEQQSLPMIPLTSTPSKSILSMPSISPLMLPQADIQEVQLPSFNVSFVPVVAEEASTSTVAAALPVETSTAEDKITTEAATVEERAAEISVEKTVAAPANEKVTSPVVQYSSAARSSQNPRRQSLSTPRRNRGHVRTLDFSTPPRNGRTPRRAHTSPKGRGSHHKQMLKNRFSPSTAKKLSKAARRVLGLVQSPNRKARITNIVELEETIPESNNESALETTEDINATMVAPQIQEKSRFSELVVSGGENVEETSVTVESEIQVSVPPETNNTSLEVMNSSLSSSTNTLSSSSSLTSSVSPVKATAATVGIATRTPGGPTITKSCWDKVTGVDLILGSPPTPSPVKTTTPAASAPPAAPTPAPEKKSSRSWDTDLRKLLGTNSKSPGKKSAEKNIKKLTKKAVPESTDILDSNALAQTLASNIDADISPTKIAFQEILDELALSSGDDFESPKKRVTIHNKTKTPSTDTITKIIKSVNNKNNKTNIVKNKKNTVSPVKRKVEPKKPNKKSNSQTLGEDHSNSTATEQIQNRNELTTTASASQTKESTEPSTSKDKIDSQAKTCEPNLLEDVEKELTMSIKKVVIQSPRTVSKHIVVRNEIQVTTNTKSPRRAIDMSHIKPTLVQAGNLQTPRKLDETTAIGQDETPLTKFLREQPLHELTVIDTPVFPMTPNCELIACQAASPPSPDDSPYYPPPKDNYDFHPQSEVDSNEMQIVEEDDEQIEAEVRETSTLVRKIVEQTPVSKTAEVQSSRTSSRIKAKQNTSTHSDSNISSSDEVKKCSSKMQIQASSSQPISIELLLAAEQNRIGLKKSHKKTPKKGHRRSTRSAENTSSEQLTDDASEENVKHARKDSETSGKQHSVAHMSPQWSTPHAPQPLVRQSPPLLISDEETHQEKALRYKELLDKKKQRIMTTLKRGFCANQPPVVNLRPSLKRSRPSRSSASKTQATKNNSASSTRYKATNKPKSPDNSLNVSTKECSTPSKKDNNSNKQKPDNNISVDISAEECPSTSKSGSKPKSKPSTKSLSLSKSQVKKKGEELKHTSSSRDLSASLLHDRLSRTALLTQEPTESYPAKNTNIENQGNIIDPSESTHSDICSTELIHNRTPPRSGSEQTLAATKQTIQPSPAKLRSPATPARKSVSVDEIANRLRSAVGMSDDEEMPPLVFEDSPVKSPEKTRELNSSKDEECRRILQQLEQSPVSSRATVHLMNDTNVHALVKENQHQSKELELRDNNNASLNLQHVSEEDSAQISSTASLETQLMKDVNSSEHPVETSSTNIPLALTSQLSEKSVMVDKSKDLTKLHITNSKKSNKTNSPSSKKSTKPSTRDELQSKVASGHGAYNSKAQTVSSIQSSAGVALRARTVADIAMKHDPRKKYPEYKPRKTEVKNLTIAMLINEDGTQEVGKKITLSCTPTHELLLLRPQRRSPSTDQVFSKRHIENRSSTRHYYPSHRITSSTSHRYRDRHSRSYSPLHHTPQRSRHSHYDSSQDEHSQRHRRSRSTSSSRVSPQYERHRRSRERHERRFSSDIERDNEGHNSEKESGRDQDQHRDMARDTKRRRDRDYQTYSSERESRGDRDQHRDLARDSKRKRDRDVQTYSSERESRRDRDQHQDLTRDRDAVRRRDRDHGNYSSERESAKNRVPVDCERRKSRGDGSYNALQERERNRDPGNHNLHRKQSKDTGRVSDMSCGERSNDLDRDEVRGSPHSPLSQAGSSRDGGVNQLLSRQQSLSPVVSPNLSSAGNSPSNRSESSSRPSPVADERTDEQSFDELMTYALVGSERVAEPTAFHLPAAASSTREVSVESTPEVTARSLPTPRACKRRGSVSISVPSSKKHKEANPQEMLREVGLDNFLSALHGDEDS